MACEGGVAKVSAANLTELGGILSKPTALWGFIPTGNFLTSSCVVKENVVKCVKQAMLMNFT